MPERGRYLAAHPNLEVLALGFLPGLMAGIHLAGLLFFLNPDLPFGRLLSDSICECKHV